jgi:hypothetical protein
MLFKLYGLRTIFVQVKELGIALTGCSCLATDASKLFGVYWYLGVPHTPIPPTWPDEYNTIYNKETPMSIRLNNTNSLVYMSVSGATVSDLMCFDLNVVIHTGMMGVNI